MNKRFRIYAGICVMLCLGCVLLAACSALRDRFGGKTQPVQAAGTVPVSGVPLVLPETAVQTEEAAAAKEDSSTEAGETEVPEPPETSAASETSEARETEAAGSYVSPIDFSALQAKNPDICAWIFIEGSDISYPVLQNADDSFYLDHDENRESNPEGAIFSESAYNGASFEDSITVLYGHHMKSGRMFGNLQAMFSDPEQFEKCGDIAVYTPEKELHYRVFAAVPYDNRHIMYHYGKDGDIGLLNFQDSVAGVKSLDARIDKDMLASPGDRLLVLSTCLQGDRTKRFLVVAKLVQPE